MTRNPQFSRYTYLLVLLAWPLLCLTLILVGMIFHLNKHELIWGWPVLDGWQLSTRLLILLAVVTASLACILTVFAILKTYQRKQLGNWLEWVLLHLFIFAGIWIILPFSFASSWLWVLGAVFLAGTAFLIAGSFGPAIERPAKYYFSFHASISDGIFILLPLLAGLGLSEEIYVLPASGTILSLILLYPLYALIQLSVFLLIPATRMQKLGYSPATIVFSCAVVFSMVHWPNLLLMTVTGLAMLVWSHQFIRGRSILALALVMGMAATGFKLTLPQPWSWDMRIGPDYTEKRAGHALETESLQQE